MVRAAKAWALLVGDGTRVEYAPELYMREAAARREAYRWAWILADGLGTPIRRRGPMQWSVGFRDVLLVEIHADVCEPAWVVAEGRGPLGEGTAVHLTNRNEAHTRIRRWARARETEFVTTTTSVRSAEGDAWIDGQWAKLCGC